MAAPTSALTPTHYVSEVPGRFSPFVIVDKRNPAGITTSTATSAQLAYLVRAESASHDLNVPLTPVAELGTNFHVGDFDDIPENKVSLTCYDVGPRNISLLTGKLIAATGTTTFGFNELNLANVDMIRQFADPAGNIFKSEYFSDHVIEEYNQSLKAKSASMEMFMMTGFNTAVFAGAIQAKSYVVQAADVTANSFSIAALLGVDESPYQIPAPSGQPAGYWIQTGRLNFLKIERWRPTTGFIRLSEVASNAAVAPGYCSYTAGTTTLAFAAGDLVPGDLFLLTYMSYTSDVTSMSPVSGLTGINYNKIPQLTTDTSDPTAVPTRLVPITIGAYRIQRGQSLDIKLTLKRDRAEGIGDADGIFGPSDAPEVSLSLDVKATDTALDNVLQNGVATNSSNGGTTAHDFFDPSQATRNQLATAVPLTVTINDPRNAGVVLETITAGNAVFHQRTVSTPAKGAATVKYSGKDQVGNLLISVTK